MAAVAAQVPLINDNWADFSKAQFSDPQSDSTYEDTKSND